MAKGQMRSNKEKKKPKQDKNKDKGAAAPSPFAGMHSQAQPKALRQEIAGAARGKHPPLQGEGRRAKRVGVGLCVKTRASPCGATQHTRRLEAAAAGAQCPVDELRKAPVLTSPNPLSTLLQRFACARLSRPRLPESCPGVSATLTTTAFDRSSLRWLEIST